MRIVKVLIGLIVVAAAVLVPTVASHAATTGTIQLWVTPNFANNGAGGKVVITGVIADYGTYVTENSAGKLDANGHYKEVKLAKGTIFLNGVALDKAVNNAPPTTNNTTNCSATFGGSGPVTAQGGTGAYKGITGTLTLTEQFAEIGPKIKSGAKKGQCNESNNAEPIAVFGMVTGTGSISIP